MSENDSNLSNITERLAYLRKSEAEQSAQASAIIEKHLAAAGLPFKKTGKTTSWSGCSWDLYINIDQILNDETHSEILRVMFAELVDFCEISTSESFEYKLKILLEKFIESDSQKRKLTPLLPEKAVVRFDEIRRMMHDDHEQYLEMMNQQGY